MLLHFDSVLVLVIVTKILLSIAILFYALVYDDDDDDDEFESGRHIWQAQSAGKILSCLSTILALRVAYT